MVNIFNISLSITNNSYKIMITKRLAKETKLQYKILREGNVIRIISKSNLNNIEFIDRDTIIIANTWCLEKDISNITEEIVNKVKEYIQIKINNITSLLSKSSSKPDIIYRKYDT
jgi:hypothetical protein